VSVKIPENTRFYSRITGVRLLFAALILFLFNSAVYAQPKISVKYTGKPGDLDVGSTLAGITVENQITIINTGSSKANVTIQISGAAFSVERTSFTVWMNRSEIIHVYFTPPETEPYTGMLYITSDDPDNPEILVPLTGTGMLPEISFVDTVIDFGIASIDSPDSLRLPILNSSIVPLTITNIIKADTGSAVFTLSDTTEVIQPGGSSGIFVTFTPDTRGVLYDTLTVYSNASNVPVQRIYLTGSRFPELYVSADTLDFGEVRALSTASLSLVLANVGEGVLNITGITAKTSYFSVSQTIYSLNPGDSTEIHVKFTPDRRILYKDSLSISSNDTLYSLKYVYLEGSGLAPVVDLFHETLDFDSVALSAPSTLYDTIRNAGDDTLFISSVSLSNSVFSTSLPQISVVPPGDLLSFQIIFSPETPGLSTGTLTIESNDPDNPSTVISLTGIGKVPAIVVLTPPWVFSDLAKDSSQTIDVKIQNTCLYTLTVSSISVSTPEFFAVPASPLIVGGELAPDSIRSIRITFTPTADDSMFIDMLEIRTTNAPVDSLVKVPLRGNPSSNHVPVFTVIPDSSIYEGSLYRDTVTAVDPDAKSFITYSLVTSPAGMTINSITGEIVWQTDSDDLGFHQITIQASDQFSADTTSFIFTVNGITKIDQNILDTVHVDSLYSFQVLYSQATGVTAHFRLIIFPVSPTRMTITSTGLIEWTPLITGDFPVKFVVEDGLGNTIIQPFTIHVTPDLAPQITWSPDGVLMEDSKFTDIVLAVDWEDTLLNFTLLTAPDSMRLNSSTGEISWTPVNEDVGDHTISLRVEDSKGNYDEKEFLLSVKNTNDPPTISGISDTTLFEDIPAVLRFNLYDPDPIDTLFVSDNSSLFDADTTGVIQFTPRNCDTGTDSLWIAVTDGDSYDTLKFILTIQNVNDPPELAAIPDTSISVGDSLIIQTQAVDVDDDTLTYSFISAPPQAVLSSTGRITWKPNENMQGIRPFIVRVCDSSGAADTTSFNVIVFKRNRPPKVFSYPQFAFKEDESLRLSIRQIGYDSDNSYEDLSFTIEGGISITDTIYADTVAFFTAPPDWNGNEHFLFILTDPGGLADTLSTMIIVLPVNDPPKIASVSPPVNDPIYERDTLRFEFDAVDIDEDTLLSTWLVNSDSVSSAPEFEFIASRYDVGEYELRLQVTDRIDTVSHTWNITVAPAVTGIEKQEKTIPDSYRLFGPYPNPFNPSVTIPYALPEDSHVVINIYNLSGAIIRTLISERMPPGYHSVQWNGINNRGISVASGWYIVRMHTGKISIARRIMLLR